MRMEVRSRTGNAVLGIVGLVYVFAALMLLVYDLMQTWHATSLVDYAVQIVLVGSALIGVIFIIIAERNLGLHPSRREAQHHPEGAAVVR